MNDVGKPCARERHARFDRGPLGRLTHVAGTAGLGPVRWKATTMAWSRPEPQQWSAEPVAYLTVDAVRHVRFMQEIESDPRVREEWERFLFTSRDDEADDF